MERWVALSEDGEKRQEEKGGDRNMLKDRSRDALLGNGEMTKNGIRNAQH